MGVGYRKRHDRTAARGCSLIGLSHHTIHHLTFHCQVRSHDRSISCPTPSPIPAASFVPYGADQRCLEARPWYTFGNGEGGWRRALPQDKVDMHVVTDHRLLEPADSLEGCAQACYSVGLRPTFYFALAGGECYCCHDW